MIRNILLVTFDPPQNVGGIEGRANNYTRELKRLGRGVELISFSPGAKYSTKELWGARFLEFPSSSRSVFKSLRLTRREINQNSISHIFLLSGGLTLYGIFILLYARFRGIRSLVFFYGKDILVAKSGFFGSLALWLAPRLAKGVVTNSHFTAGLLPERIGKKAMILYPSVDPNIAESVKAVERSDGKQCLLFVGRLVRRKGVEDLLRAMQMIGAPNLSLEIVGDGPELESLKSLCTELGLSERVRFYGTLSGTPLYQRYAESSVFVMPSRTEKSDVEGFGTVFLEAGLFGKPSVGTSSGGIPEAILDGVTGLIVPESDPLQLSEAISKLLANPDLATKMGEQARRRVISEFTWEKGTELLISFLSPEARPKVVEPRVVES